MTTDPNILGIDEYRQLVVEAEIDTVTCAVPDIYGRLMGKRLTTEAFETLCLKGDGVHGSNYVFASDIEMNPMDLEFSSDRNGWKDFRMVPDLTTLRRVPWEPNAAMVLCDAYYGGSDDLIEVAPRTILRRQVERAKQHDIAFKFASELEFFVAAVNSSAAFAARYQGIRMLSDYRGDYQILQASRDEFFIHQIRSMMPKFAIPIESSKTEWGLGQQEVTLDYCDTLTMADRHILFKHGIKELASKNELTASFMAKPHIDEVGSSCHLHFSLWSDSDGMPLDWADNGMSDVFGSFISGQLENAIGLGLLYAPTVNSYKRFVPDQFAGSVIALGHDNRSCSFRIVGHGASYRLENRIPGADTNPYLAYAGCIAAGLDGVSKAMPKPPVFVGNAWRDDALPLMPTSLQESLGLFAESKVAVEALGEQVHQHLLGFYRHELRAFNSETVTDWERMRYFERI